MEEAAGHVWSTRPRGAGRQGRLSRLLGRPERGPGPSGPLGPRPQSVAALARARHHRSAVGQDGDAGGNRGPDGKRRLQTTGELVPDPLAPPALAAWVPVDPPRTQPRPARLAAGAGPLSWTQRICSASAGGGVCALPATTGHAPCPRPWARRKLGRALAWLGGRGSRDATEGRVREGLAPRE